MPEQKQHITIIFKVKHSPDYEPHLLRVAQAYFKGKGVELGDDGVIEI